MLGQESLVEHSKCVGVFYFLAKYLWFCWKTEAVVRGLGEMVFRAREALPLSMSLLSVLVADKGG